MNSKHFLALIKEVRLKKDKAASVNGEIGNRIKEAVENGSLHRGAFALCLKMVRFDEEKRTDFLRAFDEYREICEQADLFGSEHVGDLADMAQADDAEQDAQQHADDAQVAANTDALEKGIKPLTRQEELAALFERGRIAYLEGKPGVTPDDLVGKPKLSDEYLRGWGSMAELTVEEREALKAKRQADAEFDDETSKKPSRRGRKPAGLGEAGDAPGSYAPVH